MLDKLFANSPQEELEGLTSMVNSSGWTILKRLLVDHSQYLQKELNLSLKKHEDRKAGELLAALEENKNILTMVRERITTLQSINKEE